MVHVLITFLRTERGTDLSLGSSPSSFSSTISSSWRGGEGRGGERGGEGRGGEGRGGEGRGGEGRGGEGRGGEGRGGEGRGGEGIKLKQSVVFTNSTYMYSANSEQLHATHMGI